METNPTPNPAPNAGPNPAQVSFPSVDKSVAQGFSKVWNKGGITILLDDTAIQFATDFANIALRSFVVDQMQKFEAMRAAQAAQAAAVGTQTVLPPDYPVPEKRLIVEA